MRQPRGLVALFSVGYREGLGTLSTKQNSLQPALVAGVWETLNRTQRALFMQLLFTTAGGADVLPAQNRVLRYLSAVGGGCSDPADDSFRAFPVGLYTLSLFSNERSQ